MSLLLAYSLLDLTSLNEDDTDADIQRLCSKASIGGETAKYSTLGDQTQDSILKTERSTHVAAVCVYPRFVPLAKNLLEETGVKIATVAGGFPSGEIPLQDKLDEIRKAVDLGADEIDVVINRVPIHEGNWSELRAEIASFREATKGKVLKVILGTGALSKDQIYSSALIAVEEGADFLKTSSGREMVNATLEAGMILCRVIKDHHAKTRKKVGLKPAGGIRTPQQALEWIDLVRQELGEQWLTPELFRIGASALVDALFAPTC